MWTGVPLLVRLVPFRDGRSAPMIGGASSATAGYLVQRAAAGRRAAAVVWGHVGDRVAVHNVSGRC